MSRRAHQVVGEPFPSTGFSGDLRPDGLQLATTTEEGVILRDLDPNHWADAACLLAGRNLTRREWARYRPDGGAYKATCSQWPAGA